jgi:hypothetical protein
LLLLPEIVLETRGVFVYKKFSFERARRFFSAEEWAIIPEISRIRNSFSYSSRWASLLLRLPTYWYAVLFVRLCTRPRAIDRQKVRRFVAAVEREVAL